MIIALPGPTTVTATVASTTLTGTSDINLKNVNGAAISNSNPVQSTLVANGSVNSLSNPVFVSNAGNGESVAKGGTAAAPTAGSAILTMTSNLPAGRYQANLTWSVSGAIETSGLNLRLSDASGSFTAVDFPTNNGSANGQSWTAVIPRLNVTSGTNTIKVTAVAAAVASTVYSANLVLTQIG